MFMNDVFVIKIPVNNRLPGGELCLGAMPKATVSYDYLRIYYPDEVK